VRKEGVGLLEPAGVQKVGKGSGSQTAPICAHPGCDAVEDRRATTSGRARIVVAEDEAKAGV